VAVIGKANVDLAPLRGLTNVRLLGRRPYDQLPRYCKAFSVGVMPFVLNELTSNVNPIKMREYLSAGLPVVSTDLPEVRGYSESVRVAHSPDDFVSACEEAIAADDAVMRRRRSEAMAGESWESKVAELGRWVRNAEARRRQRDDNRLGGAFVPAGATA
jgi:glycosyltransferase involved in cell wall biosynthesis